MAAVTRCALLATMLLVGLVRAEREVSDDRVALTIESDTHFRRMARARAKVGAASAVGQLTLHEARHMVLAHIGAFSEKPDNVADFHLKAQETLLEVIKMWSGATPDVHAGIQRIGTGLWGCLELLLPREAKGSDYYDKLKAAWARVFADLPETDREVREHLRAYSEEARPELLAKVVAVCVKAGLEVVRAFMPDDVALEVSKYFDGVVDIMDGIVQGWTAFAEGKTVQGVEFIFDGLKDAADDVLPDSAKNDEAYKIIMATLDGQVRKLNDHVMRFKRRLQESSVCWREDVRRMKALPRICGNPAWPGFYYAGNGFCKSDGHSLLQQGELGNRTVDEVLASKNSPAPAPTPSKNTRRALCDSSDGQEEFNEKCIYPCPDGMVQTQDGLRCLTRCWGNKSFPAPTVRNSADGNMCGASPQFMQMVKAEMAVAVVAATMRVVPIIQQMVTDGRATAEAISGIIDGVITIAVPFNNPQCEREGGDGGEQVA